MKRTYVIMMIFFLNHTLMADKRVTVSIDYGNKKPAQTINVIMEEGMTALELLKKAVPVTTKKAGSFTFVDAINGIKSHSKTQGWFYKIDGKDAKLMASKNILDDIESMQWELKRADCGM